MDQSFICLILTIQGYGSNVIYLSHTNHINIKCGSHVITVTHIKLSVVLINITTSLSNLILIMCSFYKSEIYLNQTYKSNVIPNAFS